jgi:hypothetical protein
MRLTLFTAVALALVSGLLPGRDRSAPGKQVKARARSPQNQGRTTFSSRKRRQKT